MPGIIEEEAQVARIVIYLNSGAIHIGALYSAPCYRVTEGLLLSIFREMQMGFILGGDFNSKHPRWGQALPHPVEDSSTMSGRAYPLPRPGLYYRRY